MKLIVLFVSLILISKASISAGLNCVTKKEVNGYLAIISIDNCKESSFGEFQYSISVEDADGHALIDSKVELDFIPKDITVFELNEFVIVHYFNTSTSSLTNILEVYDSTNGLKHIGTIHDALNQYQANQRSGSEREVHGFYKSNGVYLIDSLTTEGQASRGCNACQTYTVKTTALLNGKLVDLYLRDFDIENYRLLELPIKSFGSAAEPALEI